MNEMIDDYEFVCPFSLLKKENRNLVGVVFAPLSLDGDDW